MAVSIRGGDSRVGEAVKGRAQVEFVSTEDDCEWNMVSRKRRNAIAHSAGSNRPHYVTIFVDNLPGSMGNVWLGQIFSRSAQVIDTFIPGKRTQKSNLKFGFVRFKSMEDATRAVHDQNGLLVRNHKIRAKLASYAASQNRGYVKKDGAGVSHGGVKGKVFQQQDKDKVNVRGSTKRDQVSLYNSRSYADVVCGVKKPSSCFSVKAREEEVGWLSRSAVAVMSSLRSIESIKEAFISEGIVDIQIKHMGGKMMILTFPTTEDRDSMLGDGSLCWLQNWFSDISCWNAEHVFSAPRFVWLSCYGVPLNLWNAGTFFNIGKIWGDIIKLDEATSNVLSFAVGKILISTINFEAINDIVYLEFKGKQFPVRVVEEQMVVSSILQSMCSCKGCVFHRSRPNDSSDDDQLGEKDDDELGIEVEVQSEGEQIGGDVDADDEMKDVNSKLSSGSKVGESNSPLGCVNDVDESGESGGGLMVGNGPLLLRHLTIEDGECSEQVEEIYVGENISPTMAHDPSLPSLGPVEVMQSLGHTQDDIEDIGPVSMRCNNPSEKAEILRHNTIVDQVNSVGTSTESQVVASSTNPILLGSHLRSRKKKSIDEIMGMALKEVGDSQGAKQKQKKGKGGRQKNVMFRAAAAAISLSVSSEGILNRNRILLNESEAAWAIGKMLGVKSKGGDQEVISKMVEAEERDEAKFASAKKANS